MLSRSRLSLTFLLVAFPASFLLFYSYSDVNISQYASQVIPNVFAASKLKFDAERIASLEMRPGLTVFGDSYSVNHTSNWTNNIKKTGDQIVSMQGASIDDEFAHLSSMTSDARSKLPDDLPKQAKHLNFLTETMIIWFGVNDLMTLRVMPTNERQAANQAEFRTLFSLVDLLIENGVKHFIIPNVIDIFQTPGLLMLKKSGWEPDMDADSPAVREWNALLQQEIDKRPEVTTIDFYGICNEWLSRPADFGIKEIIQEHGSPEYMWQDPVHFTPWMHKNLIAPLFDKALAAL